MAKDRNPGLDLNKFITTGNPVGSGLPTAPEGYGDSQYDKNFNVLPVEYSENPLRATDLEDSRAAFQPFTDKLGNGLAKFTGSLSAGLLGVPGTFAGVFGTIGAGFEGKWDPSSFWDNSFTKLGDDINKSLQESNVNYASAEERSLKENSPWSPGAWLTSSNFWTDTILGNAGYAASAYITGVGISSLIGKAAPLLVNGTLANVLRGAGSAEELALNSRSFGVAAEAIEKASRNLKIFDRLNKGLSLAIATSGEAGMEAYTSYDEFKQNKIKNFEDQYGYSPNDEQLANIEADAKAVGNTVYGLNLPIIGAANILQFGKVIGSKWNSELAKLSGNTFALETAEQFGKYSLSKEVKRPILGAIRDVILKDNLSEAAQEGMQFLASEGTKNFYMRKYDPKGVNTLKNIIESFTDAGDKLFNTSEGAQNMLAGFFTGGLMPSTYHDIISGTRDKMANTKQAAEILNSYDLKENIKPIAENLARAASISQEQTSAVQRGDRKTYEDLKNDSIKSWVLSRIKSGRYDVYEEELDKMSDMRKEEFASFFGLEQDKVDSVKQELASLKTKGRSMKEAWDKIDSIYSGRFMNLSQNDPDIEDKRKSIEMYKTFVWSYLTDYNDKDKRVADLSKEVTNLTGKYFSANDLLNTSQDPKTNELLSQYQAIIISEKLLSAEEDSKQKKAALRKIKRDKTKALDKLQRVTERKSRKNQGVFNVSFDDLLNDLDFSYIEDFRDILNQRVKALDTEDLINSMLASGVTVNDFITKASDLVQLAEERRLALISFNNLNKANKLEDFLQYKTKAVNENGQLYNVPDYEKMDFFKNQPAEQANDIPSAVVNSDDSIEAINQDISTYKDTEEFRSKVNSQIYEGDENNPALSTLSIPEITTIQNEYNSELEEILKDFSVNGKDISVQTKEDYDNLKNNRDRVKELLVGLQATKNAIGAKQDDEEAQMISKQSRVNPRKRMADSAKAKEEIKKQTVEENSITSQTEPSVATKEDLEVEEDTSNQVYNDSNYLVASHNDIVREGTDNKYVDGKLVINYDSPFEVTQGDKKVTIQSGYNRDVFDPAAFTYLKPGDTIQGKYEGDYKGEKVIGLYSGPNFIGFLPSINNARIKEAETKHPDIANKIKTQIAQIRAELTNYNQTTTLNIRGDDFAISRGILFFNAPGNGEAHQFINIREAFGGEDFVNLTPAKANTKGGVFITGVKDGNFVTINPSNGSFNNMDNAIQIDQNNKLRNSKYDGQLVGLIPTNNLKSGKRIYMPILLSTEHQDSSRVNKAFTTRVDDKGSEQFLPEALLDIITDPVAHRDELLQIMETLYPEELKSIRDQYKGSDQILYKLLDSLFNKNEFLVSDLFDKLIYTDTRSVTKKHSKTPFGLMILRTEDPNAPGRFRITLDIDLSRNTDRIKRKFRIDLANGGQFFVNPVEERVKFYKDNNTNTNIEYVDYDELKDHIKRKPYRIDLRELTLTDSKKSYKGFVIKNNKLNLINYSNYINYIADTGFLTTNIHGQDSSNNSKFYFANQAVRFQVPSVSNTQATPNAVVSKKSIFGVSKDKQAELQAEANRTVAQEITPEATKKVINPKTKVDEVKSTISEIPKGAETDPRITKLKNSIFRDDIAKKLTQQAQGDQSFEYYDTEKINSLNQLIYKPLEENLDVQNSLVEYTRKNILKVLYSNYQQADNKGLSFSKIKALTKNLISKDRDILEKQAASEDAVEAYIGQVKLSYYDNLLLKNDGNLDLFDYRDSQNYKDIKDTTKAYKDFIGFFNLAMGEIYRSGLFKASSSSEDILEYSTSEQSYTERFQENWSFKVNPKDSILIKTKLFLSMLPVLERSITSEGEVVFTPQLEESFDTIDFYDVNGVVDHVLDITSEIQPTKFYDELFGDELGDLYANDPVIASLREELIKNKNQSETLDNNQLFNQFATSMLKTRKKLLTVRMSTTNKGATVNIIDSARVRVNNQIIESWIENFKSKSKDLFVSDYTHDETENTTKLTPENKEYFVRLRKKVQAILELPENSRGHYTDEAYKELSNLISSFGITLSENPEESWSILKSLNNPMGKVKNGKVQKRVFNKFNPSKKNFRDFVNDIFTKYIVDNTISSISKNRFSLTQPFKDSGAALDTWAKIAKPNYSKFINSTVTNVNGDNVYTYTARNYLTNQALKLKDLDYLNELATLPFTKHNQLIKNLIENEDLRNNFDLFFLDGLKKDSWQVISTEQAEPGSLELMSMLLYQNDEQFTGGRRNAGYYMTTHADATVAPLYRFEKNYIDLTFKQDNSIVVNGTTRELFYGIFKSELERINDVYNKYINLDAETSDYSNEERINTAHLSGLKEGYHYIIKDGGKTLAPGNGVKLYLFGQKNYNNNDKGLYDPNGVVTNSKGDFIPYQGLHPALLTANQLNDDGVRAIFDSIIDEYVSDLVNSQVNSLEGYGEYLYNINTVKKTYPLPEGGFITEEESEFKSDVFPTKFINKFDTIFDKFTTYDNNENLTYVPASQRGELFWKYLNADYALNYSLFLSTWNQTHHDPAFYVKGTTYESFFDNYMKRLKGDISPGEMNNVSADDKVNYVVFNDVSSKDIKVTLTKEQHTALPKYIKEFLAFRKTYGQEFEDNKISLPERYQELATIYKTLKGEVTDARLNEIISQYENIKVADAQAYITLNEFLYRKWKDGIITTQDVNFLRSKYSDPNLNYNEKEFRKDFKLQGLKYVYSGSDISSESLSYDFNKNAELPLIPALTKNKVIDDIRKGLESLENSLYSSSDKYVVNPGVIAVPLSSYKVGSDKVINLIGETGAYSGELNSDKVVQVPRENLKKQIQNPIKEELYNTASSQFRKFIHNDVPYNVRFASDRFKPAENDTNTPAGLSNNQLINIDTQINLNLMQRDLIDMLDELGIEESGEVMNRELVIADINKFIDILKKESFERKGLDLNSIQYLQTVKDSNKLNIPIDFTPSSSSFESIILSRFNKIINGRKLPGFSFIQASSLGFHEVENTNIKADSNLKGARLIEDANGNIIGYTPAEIAITWKFRDSNGELLNYNEYVNEDGSPKLDKFSKEMLEIVGIRIPNTGSNSAGKYRVAKFLSPAYVDTALVSPEILAQMGSDFDFDKLVTYIYNYEVIDGKLTKVESVIHNSQTNRNSVLYSENNKQRYISEKLARSEEYLSLDKKEDAVIEGIYTRQDELQDTVNSISSTLEYTDTQLSKEIKQKIADIKEAEFYFNKYSTYLSSNKALKQYFKEENIDLSNLSKSESNQRKQEEIDNIKDLVNSFGETFSNFNQLLQDLRERKEDINLSKEELKAKGADSLEDNQLAQAFKELEDVQNAKKKLIDDALANTKFEDINLYDLQSYQALENGLIDVYQTMLDSMFIFRKQVNPLTSDWIKNQVLGNSSTLNNKSIKTLFEGDNFTAINSITSLNKNRVVNADADVIIGIGANAQSGIYKAQRFNLFLKESTDTDGNVIFNEAILFNDNSGILKTEEEFTNIPKDNQSFYNKNTPYSDTLRQGRYRLDRIYTTDNNGNKLYISEVVQSVLQAALDNQNDPILGFGNVNKTTINAFLISSMLGYTDEIVPLINQDIIKEFVSLKKIANSPLYSGDLSRATIIKESLITKYALEAGIDEKTIDDLIQKSYEENLSDIEIIKRLTPNEIFSEDDLKSFLLHSSEEKFLYSDTEFAKKQLNVLKQFLILDTYGSQFLTYQTATSAESKGLGDSSLIGVKDLNDRYNNIYFVDQDDNVRSSVPNIGGVERTLFGEEEYRPNPFSIAHAMGPKKVISTFTYNKLGMFYSISPLFNEVINHTYNLLKRKDLSKKKEIAINFKSFVLSDPTLYTEMFTKSEQDEAELFFSNPQDYLLKEDYALTDNNEYNLKINNKESLAGLFNQIAEGSNSNGIPFKLMYEALTSFKTIAQDNNDKFSLVNYVNSNSYKENLDYRLAKSILAMYNSKNKSVKKLGRDLILYSFITGGINSPTSFVKFIPVEVLLKSNFGGRLRSALSKYTTSVQNDPKSLADRFATQFLQHKSHNIKNNLSSRDVISYDVIEGVLTLDVNLESNLKDEDGSFPSIISFGEGRNRIILAKDSVNSYYSIPRAGYNTYNIAEYNPNQDIIYSELTSNYPTEEMFNNFAKKVKAPKTNTLPSQTASDEEVSSEVKEVKNSSEETITEKIKMSDLKMGDIILVTVSGRRTSNFNGEITTIIDYKDGTYRIVFNNPGTSPSGYMVDEEGIIDYNSDEIFAYIHLDKIVKSSYTTIPDYLSKTTISKALEWIRNNSKEPGQDILAMYLKENLDPDLWVEADQDEKLIGAYSYVTRSIRYNLEKAVRFETAVEGFSGVIIHEAAHALTVENLMRVLDPGVRGRVTEKQIRAVNNLTTLINILNDKIYKTELFDTFSDQVKFLIRRGVQPISNQDSANQQLVIAEFMANVFAEPDFRELLNSIKISKDKTFLDRIKDLILNLLGIEAGSALAVSFDNIIALIEKNSKRLATLEKEEIIPEKKSSLFGVSREMNQNLRRDQGNIDYEMRDYTNSITADDAWVMAVRSINRNSPKQSIYYSTEDQARIAMNTFNQLKSEFKGEVKPGYFEVEYVNPDQSFANPDIIPNLLTLNFKIGDCS